MVTNCTQCARHITGEGHYEPRVRSATAGHVACLSNRLMAVQVQGKAKASGFRLVGLTWFKPHEACSYLHCEGFIEREILGRRFVEGDYEDLDAPTAPKPKKPVDAKRSAYKRAYDKRTRDAAKKARAALPPSQCEVCGADIPAGTKRCRKHRRTSQAAVQKAQAGSAE